MIVDTTGTSNPSFGNGASSPMEDNGQTSWRPLTLLAAVMAAVMFVFPLAVHFPLLDPDEGLHASIAQEMVERGNWITPHFLGRPFLDKPIFYFWVQAASLRLLGANETAVRLPGLMFGLLGAVTTGLLAWRMFGRATGLIAGILYATTILPTALAQAASHDVALVPWVNLTILLLWESSRHTPCALGPEGRRHAERACYCWCVLGAGFFLGLLILTKGLMGVAVVGLAYGGYVLCRCLSTRTASDDTNPCPISGPLSLWERVRVRAGREENPTFSSPIDTALTPAPLLNGEGTCCLRFGLVFGGVLLVAVLVAAPWYLAVEAQNPGFFRYYFLDRHLLGLASDTQPHSDQPWWYYVPVLLGGGLPWIGYLSFRGVRGQGSGAGVRKSEIRNPKSEIRNSPSAVLLLWCWLIGWTVFLTLAQSKLATYLWPAFPPLAILAALVWVKLLAEKGTGPICAQHPEGRSGKLDLSPFPPLGDAARRSFARTFVWSSWSGPIVLPVAVLVVQWVYAVRFAWPVWVAVGLAAAVSPLPITAWRAGRRQASLAAAALSVAAQFVVVMAFVLPPVANVCSARVLAEHFNRLGKLPPRLLMAEERIGSLVFYLTPRLRAGLKEDQLQNLLRDRPPPLQPGDVIVIQEVSLSRAGKYLDLSRCPYESVGRYRLYRMASPAGGRHSCLPEQMFQPGQTRMSAPPNTTSRYDGHQRSSQPSNHADSRPTWSRNIATRQPAAAPTSTSLG